MQESCEKRHRPSRQLDLEDTQVAIQRATVVQSSSAVPSDK